MSDAPANATAPAEEATREDLYAWFEAQMQLAAVKAREMSLRTKLFKSLFPSPDEGTNTIKLDGHPIMRDAPNTGYVLKCTHTISREIDEAALTVLAPQFDAAGIKHVDLVKRKPSLAVAEYRTLTKEQLAMFDQALVIKPGSPAIKLELPAKAKK